MILTTAISQRFQLEAAKSIPLQIFSYIAISHAQYLLFVVTLLYPPKTVLFPFQRTFGILNFFIGHTASSAFHYVVQKFFNLFHLFQYFQALACCRSKICLTSFIYFNISTLTCCRPTIFFTSSIYFNILASTRRSVFR